MKSRIPRLRGTAILLIVSLLFAEGCASKPYPSDPSTALKAPHSFALTLERHQGRPGDVIKAQLGFVNTGSESLWVPNEQQLQLSYELVGGGGTILLPPSQCDGITYHRVSPGRRLTYHKEFAVPGLPSGRIEVYVWEEPGTRVPFEIK